MTKILAEHVPKEQMDEIVKRLLASKRFVMVNGEVLISQEIIKQGHPPSLGKPIRVIGGIWYDSIDLRNEYVRFPEDFPEDFHGEFQEIVYSVIPKPENI